MYYTVLDSSIGKLTISANDTALTGLYVEGHRYFTAIPKNWKRDDSNTLLVQAATQIQEYLHGSRKVFDLPLYVTGTTFQEKVWNALREIPNGKTVTYSQLAATVHKPKAVRAVGSAVGRNPLCIFIPCHRVLPATGGIGDYASGPKVKERLLALENI